MKHWIEMGQSKNYFKTFQVSSKFVLKKKRVGHDKV